MDMNNKILIKEPPNQKSRYELRNVVCDYGIFENGEMMLLLNDYMNAEFILNILRYDENKKRYPNMITPIKSSIDTQNEILEILRKENITAKEALKSLSSCKNSIIFNMPIKNNLNDKFIW